MYGRWCSWFLHFNGRWCSSGKSRGAIGLASDDVTELSNAWQRRKWVLNKYSAPYSKIGFRRTQGLEPLPVGVLIFKTHLFCSYSIRRTNDMCALSRKRPKVREHTKFVETCALVAENATRCTCELCRRSNIEAEALRTGLVVRVYPHSCGKLFLTRNSSLACSYIWGIFLSKCSSAKHSSRPDLTVQKHGGRKVSHWAKLFISSWSGRTSFDNFTA